MKLNSHNGYLLVSVVDSETEKKVGSIIIPKSTAADDEQMAKGKVVVGSDTFKVDMIVYFNKLIPSDIFLEIDGKEERFFSLQEADIMFSE